MTSRLAALALPAGSTFIRSTAEFGADSVPPGLLTSHRVARDVWGLVRVLSGRVTFTSESTDEQRALGAGDTQVIEPDTPHRVALDDDARFVVEFYR
jgi:tellurite resistance-related uncharacterized protein